MNEPPKYDIRNRAAWARASGLPESLITFWDRFKAFRKCYADAQRGHPESQELWAKFVAERMKL